VIDKFLRELSSSSDEDDDSDLKSNILKWKDLMESSDEESNLDINT
jgi:hypothetical protein